VLGRRDILGAAETGSGKTLAFGIPILQGILENRSQSTGTCNFDLCGAALLWHTESDTQLQLMKSVTGYSVALHYFAMIIGSVCEFVFSHANVC
jgi:superfamily II DNA/RNA helicase